MQNLFSIFDQSSSLMNAPLNWISSLAGLMWLPSNFWLTQSNFSLNYHLLLNTLHKEFKLNFSPTNTPGITHWAICLFLFILMNNLLGLTPYTFTASSHLSFSLALGLSSWLGYFMYSFACDLNHSLAHFVPSGTPYLLMPFMVLIEMISSFIRPLTLSVRLAANMVAGHLLMTLIATPMANSSYLLMFSIFLGLTLLIVLESAVALIQAYVFSMLSTLYIGEVNYSSLNYLLNSMIFINK